MAKDSAHQMAEGGGVNHVSVAEEHAARDVCIFCSSCRYLFCTGLSSRATSCHTTEVSKLRMLFFIFISETFPE